MAELHVDVRVAAGSLAGDVAPTYVVPHQWTDSGIAVEGGGTGAHMLLTAVASCVLNDVFREAQPGIPVSGVLIEASGDFDATTWATTSIDYAVVVDSTEDADVIAQLLQGVDAVAEIPRAVAGQVTVGRR
ncbi:OsmC family peroxiredoxin [Nocardioides sp. CN2-186]|uniref:OsmC family protein n=1 Tax=Nocardioides tweenelious TaxID=3156607 RepID=UPI0032B48B51